MEEVHGEIADVLEITRGRGGINPPFNPGKITGCIMLFKSGAVMCVESDGEYADVFGG